MDGVKTYYYNAKTGEYDIEGEITNDPENTNKHYLEGVMKNMAGTVSDPVNHPSHYTSGKIEVIDFIEDQKLDFHLANALKYICRAGKKDPAKTKEDLEKAVWYINRYISHVLV